MDGQSSAKSAYPRCQTLNDHAQSKCHVFEVWRLDDNGNEFLVDVFDVRELAEMKIDELAAGGHKQMYWLKEVSL